MYAQKFIDKGKDFNLELAIKTRTISDGLRYSLATGNWGDQKKAHQVTPFSMSYLFIYLFIFLRIFFPYYIQHCFIFRPSDSTVPTDAGIEPGTVATGALAVRRSNH
jgi:hypothetical protein